MAGRQDDGWYEDWEATLEEAGLFDRLAPGTTFAPEVWERLTDHALHHCNIGYVPREAAQILLRELGPWLRSLPDCNIVPDKHASAWSKLQQRIVRNTAKRAALEAEMVDPELCGSAKQIAWAERIRDGARHSFRATLWELDNKIDAMTPGLSGYVFGMPLSPEMLTLQRDVHAAHVTYRAAVLRAYQITSCRRWIDTYQATLWLDQDEGVTYCIVRSSLVEQVYGTWPPTQLRKAASPEIGTIIAALGDLK